ncbi:hypothetical protein EDC02_1726 [Micromonospora sp. Llam0]|uniref:serine-threonine protein kinase n=1 Tax=Micromonospora sp. Llam0 TaxID=2485143 RepID=UPI000F47BFB9|nr:serine-threonine protein kinase [Micromonospora sp. Llam0]ROO59881.1 hypothetical protein EDC02_1726 [Micromonospora sp. Llam0]
MTDRRIGGLPWWELRFDAGGDPDPVSVTGLLSGARARGVTDLVVLAHGWNNDRDVADALYAAFFNLLAEQARRAGPWAESLGLVGVHWPARRWPDEPAPDFEPVGSTWPGPGPARLAGARAGVGPVGRRRGPDRPRSAGLDDETLNVLRATFPVGAPALDRMAHLLRTSPTRARVRAFANELRQFATVTADGFGDDGDAVPTGPDLAGAGRSADGPAPAGPAPALPAMLDVDPVKLYARFLDELRRCHTPLDAAAVGGAAGLVDPLRGIWHGAKEALRQLTYWQMKGRVGRVGRVGLGPVLTRLATVAPAVRIHLVGHSFGARLVSFAADAAQPAVGGTVRPVRSLTLLQGAFSRFAFAPTLPFDPVRSGALAGLPARIAGPVSVCFSTNDSALGVFYPLASLAAGDDAAATPALAERWGALGFHGAAGVGARSLPLAAVGHGGNRLEHRRVHNVDATAVVRRGGPPAGAHSDIVHPELTWLVLVAGGLVPSSG